jgi:6-phosphogluconolactonase
MNSIAAILAGLAGAGLSLSVSAAEAPDRMVVFVGTYTGGASKGIYAYEFSAKGGTLKPLGLAAETPSPSFLTFHPSKKFLYAVNEIGNYEGKKAGSITAFKIEVADGLPSGKLAKLNEVSSGGAHPCHLTVDKSGGFVLAANYSGGNLVSVSLGEDGRLGKQIELIQHTGSSVNKQRQGEPHAHSINVDPNNLFALAADLGIDKVMVYRFDSRSGTLKPNDPPFAAAPAGGGPRHLAFHPDANSLFVNNELLSSITSFNYAQKTGVLKQNQTISTLPEGWKGNNSTAEIQVHPSGKFVYCSNRGHDSIAVFSLDDQGKLKLVENESTRGKTPRNFGIDPTGNWLIAANQDSDSLQVFRIIGATGELEPLGPVVQVPKPVCVKFLAP